MVVITSHPNTDFDAFASMVAASKLYNDPVLYVPAGFSASMRRFHNYYKHSFPVVKNLRSINVSSIVIVDAGLGNVDPKIKKLALSGVKTVIYDHHPEAGTSGIKSVKISYGACATYLVEQLIKKNIPFTDEEAMLFLLGIAADTGSFTFLHTAPQDVSVSAELMKRKINMKLYADFLKDHLTPDSIKLFNTLMQSAKTVEVSGRKVMGIYADSNAHIQQLPDVVMNIHSVTSADAVVCAARMGKKIYLVGRSSDEAIDVGRLLEQFGGGGHSTAAAGVIKPSKGETARSIRDLMLGKITGNPPGILRVKDIMSTPVRAITPEQKMEDAYKVCIRLNNNGLPIVKAGRLTGFITKADIEKGIHHKLGAIPVSGYMSAKVITTSPEMAVTQAQKLMEENNIGHLPVLDKGRLVGMVTRNDILRDVYGSAAAPRGRRITFREARENVSALLKKRMKPETLEMVKQAGLLADKKGLPAYLVGGMVRDLFLNVRDLDIDITVEGDGLEFARFLADSMGGAYKGFDRFKTGKVFLKNGQHIDVASARSEFYEFPAALPSVSFTPIRYDMYRRDFTINAMAIKINKKGFGTFVDYFNGRQDLKKGIIRTLYNMSFIDDPTRIFRAVRFETRHGFTIEDNTLRFIHETLRHNVFENLSGERLREEFFILFEEPSPIKAMKRLEGLGVLAKISPAIRVDTAAAAMFKKIGEAGRMIADYKAYPPVMYMTALLGNLEKKEALKVAGKLKLSNEQKLAIEHSKDLQSLSKKGLSKLGKGRSGTYFLLKKYGTEALLYLMLLQKDKKQAARIRHFLDELKHVKIEVTGKDLREMGIKEGPEYSKILSAVMKAKLDGKAETRQEQLEFVERLLAASLMPGSKTKGR